MLHLRTRCQPARGGVPGSCWPLCAGEARSPARAWRGPLTLLVLECTKAIHAAEADWKHQESVREIPSSSSVLPVPSAMKVQRHACCKRKMLRGSRASKVSWIWGWEASHPQLPHCDHVLFLSHYWSFDALTHVYVLMKIVSGILLSKILFISKVIVWFSGIPIEHFLLYFIYKLNLGMSHPLPSLPSKNPIPDSPPVFLFLFFFLTW